MNGKSRDRIKKFHRRCHRSVTLIRAAYNVPSVVLRACVCTSVFLRVRPLCVCSYYHNCTLSWQKKQWRRRCFPRYNDPLAAHLPKSQENPCMLTIKHTHNSANWAAPLSISQCLILSTCHVSEKQTHANLTKKKKNCRYWCPGTCDQYFSMISLAISLIEWLTS